MAPPDRPPARHLTFLQAAADRLKQSGLYPVVRGAEARAPDLPRVGKAKLPAQNIVEMAQVPSLRFPAPTIESVHQRNGRMVLEGYWLGLTGPMGPLPSHLTEYADYERRYGEQRPFGRWLDLLADRMLQFYYRAWANSQPAASMDRPKDDRFGDYLAALSGAEEGVPDDALFPARARLHYANLYASRRSAGGIEDALGHLLRQPVRVLEFQPRWRDVSEEDQSRLGRQFATLGGDMMVGARVRTASDSFRVVVRANSIREYEQMLPSGPRFAIAQEALDSFAPSHLEWDIMIEMEERHARPARLDGRARLGWTGWLSPKKESGRIRADAHLTRRAVRPRHATGDSL